MSDDHTIRVMSPGQFEPEDHYYPRVPNALLHPLVKAVFRLGNERLAKRYCHLHPEVDRDAVRELLATRPAIFRWSGSDLFHVTDERGVRRNVIIETNSCPSGQKSMPPYADDDRGGYYSLIQNSFLPALRAQRNLPRGRLAVLSDKNPMETTGYARVIADLTEEDVLWIPFFTGRKNDHVRWDAGVLEVHHEGEWQPIRAAFRYVTQKPWNRIPPITKTWIYNPVLACLAGGRNKMLAAKAYDFFNAEMADAGLVVRVPETIWDVALQEVPLWVNRMGGVAVVKNPYSNAGQGVYTITSEAELDAFMELDHSYGRFIVQALIGNRKWSSRSREGRLYHVGTVPDRHTDVYVADLRMMIGAGTDGFFPVAMYARRARTPLVDELDGHDSWSMLGTNLSVKSEAGFSTEPNRLMMMDQRDFNRLGLGLDDLTEAYLQSVMATLAIDRLAQRLLTKKRTFRRNLFRTLNPDDALLDEIMA